MTDLEMKNRMKEIDEERNKLSLEKRKYEKYFEDKKKKEELNSRRSYIGKCFISKDDVRNENKHIKAFKIVDILNEPNTRYADCVTLIDGYENNCWNTRAVKFQVVGLWHYNKIQTYHDESDPKMIDFYKEITQEEFKSLYKEYINSIEWEVFK